MIFQAGIDLEIKDRNVQVNIDFDTGLIGFTEIIGEETTEFYYQNSPIQFKKALFDKFEPIFSKKNHVNFKICKKNKSVIKLINILSENK